MCELKKSRIRVRASGRAVKIEGREVDAGTSAVLTICSSEIEGLLVSQLVRSGNNPFASGTDRVAPKSFASCDLWIFTEQNIGMPLLANRSDREVFCLACDCDEQPP